MTQAAHEPAILLQMANREPSAEDAARLRDAMNRIVRDGMRSYSIMLMVLHLGLVGAYPFLYEGELARKLTITVAFIGLYFAAQMAALRRYRVPSRCVHPVVFSSVLVLLASCVLHLIWTQRPSATVLFITLMIGTGLVMHSRRWFAAAVVVTAGAWVVASLPLVADPDWALYTVGMVISCGLSISFFVTRGATVRRYELARVHDQQRKRELHQALESTVKGRAELAELTIRDPLTGAFNRRHLDAIEPELEAHDAIWGCVMIDLDDFKAVNDRYGHLEGDRVLQEMAHFLRRQGRAKDVLVRFGGDEFLVIVDIQTEAGLEKIAQRIGSASSNQSSVPFSMGFALRRPGEPLNEVLTRADQRMYSVKASREEEPGPRKDLPGWSRLAPDASSPCLELPPDVKAR